MAIKKMPWGCRVLKKKKKKKSHSRPNFNIQEVNLISVSEPRDKHSAGDQLSWLDLIQVLFVQLDHNLSKKNLPSLYKGFPLPAVKKLQTTSSSAKEK